MRVGVDGRPVGEVHRLVGRGEVAGTSRRRRTGRTARAAARPSRRHSCSVACAAARRPTSRTGAASGARTSSRGRRRSASSACAPRSASKPSSASVTVATVRCRRERIHRSSTCVGARRASRPGLPAVEVRVGDEERVRVPERDEEPARRLVDALERHALRRPRRARREEVPAQRVGAARRRAPSTGRSRCRATSTSSGRPGRRAARGTRRCGTACGRTRACSPRAASRTSRAVWSIASQMKSAGKRRSNSVGVLERVVELRGGHRARSRTTRRAPARRGARRPPLALRAVDGDVVDVRAGAGRGR